MNVSLPLENGDLIDFLEQLSAGSLMMFIQLERSVKHFNAQSLNCKTLSGKLMGKWYNHKTIIFGFCIYFTTNVDLFFIVMLYWLPHYYGV